MKYFFCLLLSVILSNFSYSQNKTIDSLKNLLNDKKDTMQVWYRSQIARQYARIHKEDTFLAYIHKALDLATEMKFVDGEMLIKGDLADNLFRSGNYSQALKVSLDYLKQAEELKDTLNIFYSMRSVMMSYEYISVDEKTIKYAEALRDIIHSGFFKDPKDVVRLELIGYVNHALAYYQFTGNLDSVLYFSQRGYELALRINHPQGLAMATANLANIQQKLGNIDLALTYNRMTLLPAKQSNRFDILAGAELDMAKIFQQKGQKDSALLYVKQGLLDLEKNTDPSTNLQVYSSLSSIYNNYNQFDSAFKYLRLSVDIKDSLFNSQKTSAIQSLMYNEQLRQQEIEQKKIQDAEERKLNLQYAAIAFGLIVFIILFLILSHSIIANQNLIRFFGIVGLLVLFEFINLFIHPYLGNVTHHSPLLMLLIMVVIAAMLVPAHHYLQKWISNRLVEKNKRIRLTAAKKTIAKLEGDNR